MTMKKPVTLITLTTGFLLLAGSALHAEEPTAAETVPSVLPAAGVVPPAPVASALADMEASRAASLAAEDEVTHELRAARMDLDKAHGVLLAQGPSSDTLQDLTSAVTESAADQMANAVTLFGRPPGSSGRTLVIRSTTGDLDGDQSAEGHLEEDMTVMSHIFDKAMEDDANGDYAKRRAMGINVIFGAASSPIRNLYLEGYGALFMLNAGIPLVAPAAHAEEPKEKPSADSSWEAARREVYGQPGNAKPEPPPAPEYDAAKVEKLKVSLLDALKSAANIRNLKADDYITVCVFGSGRLVGSPWATAVGNYDAMLKGNNSAPKSAAAGGSTLTIRVKKSDVDKFAKGGMTAEEFRQKAALTIHAGALGSTALRGRPGTRGGSYSW
jgi:hypothetical protein